MKTRINHLFLLLTLLTLMGGTAIAQRADLVTIVYDAPTREFMCWFDGPPPTPIPLDPCHDKNINSHQVADGVYFYRGQTVRVLLQGAMMADLFSLGLQVNNITEPTTPVFGGGSTIPALGALVPAPTVVNGPGATMGVTLAGNEVKKPLDLLRVVDRLEPKDFANYLNSRLINPASSSSLQLLVAPDFDKHINELKALLPGLIQSACNIQTDLTALPDPTTFLNLPARIRSLNAILDSERALREQVNDSAVASHAQLVVAAEQTAADPQFQVLRNIVGDDGDLPKMEDLDVFLGDFRETFLFKGLPAHNWIDQLTLSGASGSAKVTVSSNSTASNEAVFTIFAGPTIASMAPISISKPQTTTNPVTITVNGTGFGQDAKVLWGGTELDTTFKTATQLTASVPGELLKNPGTASVAVISGGVTSALFRVGSLAHSPTSPAPGTALTISSLSPNVITAGGGEFTLVVSGNNFVPATKVTWDGEELATTFVSSTQLTAVVPAELIAIGAKYAFKLHNDSVKFLNRLNGREAPNSINGDSLIRLKANLSMLADHLDDIAVAENRVIAFNLIYKKLKDYKSAPDAVSDFQDLLNSLTTNTVEKALRIDHFARITALPDDFRVLTVGVWYGNEEIVLTVNQGGRLPLFDLGGVGTTSALTFLNAATTPGASAASFALGQLSAPASQSPAPQSSPTTITTKTETSPTGTTSTTTVVGSTASTPPTSQAGSPASTPSASAQTPTPVASSPVPQNASVSPSGSNLTQVTASALTAARSLTFRIHNLYYFQLAAGFVYAHTRDDQFQGVNQATTGGGGATGGTAQQLIVQTRNRNYNLLATVEVLVYPWAQDFFPWKPRFIGDRRSPWYHDFAPLIGVSMTSPNRDFLGGVAWFPRQRAFGFKAGVHIALRNRPPDGTELNTPLTQPVVVLQQTVEKGPFIGLSFSTQLFSDVFGFIFGKR